MIMYNNLIRERVIKNDFRKVYSLEELSKWIEYGINKGIIKKSIVIVMGFFNFFCLLII